jgi:hypothetical protein
MTSYYTPTGNPTAAARGTSSPVRDEFQLVADGINAAQTAINLKAPIASPTFTGVPAAPTAAVGTNTTQLATTAFVASTAMAAALPTQSGNAGKFVKTDGSVASWAVVGITRSARTSNTVLGLADARSLIDVTSGSFTQTFAAVATLGADWLCYFRNSGTGDITLDPNASETIDGLTSFVVYPGETRLIQCDGAAFRSVVLSPFSRTFTAGGTFTKPPGYSYFAGLLWAGGGSGAKTTSGGANGATGGSGGACVPFMLPASIVGATETITIGALAAGPTTSTTGTNGNNSTFGALVTSYGGLGGANSAIGVGGGGTMGVGSGSTGGAPNGGASGTDSSFGGGGGGNSAAGGKSVYGGGASGGGSGAGGAALYGGGGGGAHASAVVGAGGASTFGGAGGAAVAAASGVDGTAPAGGGGGTNTGTKAGDGARGELRVWGVA